MRPLVGVLLIVAAGVAGCATASKLPPIQPLRLGAYKSGFRDYAASSPCLEDPQRLAYELEDVDTFLSEFLRATSAGMRGRWKPETLTILEAGLRQLPRALDALELTYAELPRCGFDEALGFPALVRQGRERIQDVRARVEEAPALLHFVRTQFALEKWRAEQHAQREANLTQWCGKQPKGDLPAIYYASEDETGKREWWFCEGTKVSRAPNAPPVVEGPAQLQLRLYFEAANAYPESDLFRAPKLGTN